MLMGPLLAAVRSVVMVGSPVFPTPLRMIQTVQREKCTLLKTGSAVVRQLMTDPGNAAKVDAVDTSTLRCATFCAEPVSVEVLKLAIQASQHFERASAVVSSLGSTEHMLAVLAVWQGCSKQLTA